MRILIISVVLVLSIFSANLTHAAAATISIAPASGSLKVNQTISVQIMLNNGGARFDGVDIYSLHFNPKILQVVDSNTSLIGLQITPGVLLPNTVYNKVDNINGLIKFSQIGLGGLSYLNSGAVATVKFKAIGVGVSTLYFDFVPARTSDTNVSYRGVDLLSSTFNSAITVTGNNTDTTRPTISSIVVASLTSTTATINWKTNEPATSQINYGLTTSYNKSMTNPTLVTTHSMKLTGLVPNTIYHFKIISKDGVNNQTLSVDKAFMTPR